MYNYYDLFNKEKGNINTRIIKHRPIPFFCKITIALFFVLFANYATIYGKRTNTSKVLSMLISMIEKETSNLEAALKNARIDENSRKHLLANPTTTEFMIDMIQEKAERYNLTNEVYRLKHCRSMLRDLQWMNTEIATKNEKEIAKKFLNALDYSDKILSTENPATQTEKELAALKKIKTGNRDRLLKGVWDGVLLPMRGIISLFKKKNIYSDFNNGAGYLVGFITGILILLTIAGGFVEGEFKIIDNI